MKIFQLSIPTIIHKPSEFRFEILPYHNQNYFCGIKYSPGKENLFDENLCRSWSDLKIKFSNWLDFVEREFIQIDEWSLIEQEVNQNELLQIQSFNNEAFLDFEKEIVKNRIKALRNKFYELGFANSDLDFINEKLNLLIENTERLNKFDWKSLFLGTIISIIIQLSISQEQGHQIWRFIHDLFNNLFLSN